VCLKGLKSPKIVERQLLFLDIHTLSEAQLIIRGFLIPNNGEKNRDPELMCA
jgi:hypothetical protein